jgi:hypothetical protein
MNLNYSKRKKENATLAVGSAYGASQASSARSSQPTWPFSPRPRGRGSRSHGTGRRLGRIPPVPTMWCSTEGPGSKEVVWWSSFRSARERSSSEEWSRWGVVSRRGTAVGGGVWEWWSAAHGAGRSYMMARCSGCGRGSGWQVNGWGAVGAARWPARGSDRAADGGPHIVSLLSLN